MEARGTWNNEYDALNAWKAAVESRGVLVMQISGVDTAEMRGCSLARSPLPIILLNSSESPLGRVFTLFHELAHLARAESGLCDVLEDRPRVGDAQSVETYCNHVAGAILVPREELLRQTVVAQAGPHEQWDNDRLRALSRTFWASREVVLRRLLSAGKTSRQFYQRMHEQFEREYAAQRAEGSGGFVSVPRRVVLANGRFLTRLAIDAYNAEVITGSALSRILGTKLDHLSNIVDVLRGRAAA
jgi:Zn-dependent peptidase ImmA (M78 family)